MEEADTEFRFAPEVAREGIIKGTGKIDRSCLKLTPSL